MVRCRTSFLTRVTDCHLPSPSTLESLCQKFLGVGEGKVSDELIALKEHSSTLALREPIEPDILWDPEYTALAFRGLKISERALDAHITETGVAFGGFEVVESREVPKV